MQRFSRNCRKILTTEEKKGGETFFRGRIVEDLRIDPM